MESAQTRRTDTKAGSYSRVSTEEQVQGLSLSAQQRGIREYCAAKGWDMPEEFVDEGRSARSEAIERRPALQSLLEACERRELDVVVVYSLDRWARNLMATLQTFGLLAKAGVAFASVTESIDYTTPEGRLFVAMLGAFAQYFSDNLAKHTSKGIAERVHQGRPAGPIPFGYKKGGDGTVLPVEAEAGAVKQIFRLRASGQTTGHIATWLNGQGFRTRQSRLFTNFAIRDMLKNPFYTGRLSFKGDIYSGAHEGIIDITLYETVRALRQPRTRSGQVKHYLLKGLARCVRCGALLWSCTNSRGHDYYRHWSGYGDCPVGNRMVPCTVIDAQLERLVGALRMEEDWRENVIERVIALSERERIAGDRRQCEDRLRRLTRAYIDGMIADKAYEAESRRLKERVASLNVPEVDTALEAGEQTIAPHPRRRRILGRQTALRIQRGHCVCVLRAP